MKSSPSKFGEGLRVILAIVAKDLLEAVKNKTILSMFLTAMILLLVNKTAPSLWNADRPPVLAVYDAGSSSLVADLEESDQFNTRRMESQEELEWYLGYESFLILGVTLPAEFDQRLEIGEELTLDGYIVHWANEDQADEMQTFFETQFTELAGKPVRINLDGHTVYTTPDGAKPFLTAAILVVILTLISISVIPGLMLEEKQSKTLDALLVSPASAGQVVIAKAIVGLLYSLAGAAVVMALNVPLLLHPGVTLLAVVAGSAFTVGVGLLMGSLLKEKQQLSAWTLIMVQPLLLPVFLTSISVLPETVKTLFSFIPTVALSRILQLSFSGRAPLSEYGAELALVFISAALVLALAAWVVRRSDR